MSTFHPQSDRTLFPAVPDELEAFDGQDLMAYPFFSLAKKKRLAPIDFRVDAVSIHVEAVPENGMATIWDADVLIWAAKRIVTARDRVRPASRILVATPDEILTFAGRGKSMRDVQRLKAALDRLQSTSIATSIRRASERRHHRFSCIEAWRETADANGRTLDIELTLPVWFYSSIRTTSLDLTIDRQYFALSGGLERWLYRLLKKHRGVRESDWNFDLAHLHARSATLSTLHQFATELGKIVHRQALPGYRLRLSRDARDVERLLFAPLKNDAQSDAPCGERADAALPPRSDPSAGDAP